MPSVTITPSDTPTGGATVHSNHLPPLTVVALTGLAGSGKDTVADVLVNRYGFCKIAFAGALRAEVAAAFDVDVAYLTQRETKEHPISVLALDHCLDPGFALRISTVFSTAGLSSKLLSAPRSPRQIMQWWGTEYRRADDPRYWTIKMHEAVMHKFTFMYTDCFVIPDCRFDNEAELVRSYSGKIWQVERPGLHPTAGAHVSETEGSHFVPDALLRNTDSIDYLQLQTLAACNRLRLPRLV